MGEEIGLLRKLVLVAFMVFVYCFVLLRGLNEASRRSLQLRDDTDAADHIAISMLVIGVDPSAHELTAALSRLRLLCLHPPRALSSKETFLAKAV
jgi:hypothetical protein